MVDKKKTKAEKVETKEPVKVDKKAPEKVAETKVEKVEIPTGNFIMTVTSLPWGKNNGNQFYAKQKPEINAKVMGKFADTLLIWLDAGWIQKGSYKK